MTTSVSDVVIVGGGSAGCVLAARLSQNPELEVVLVEAGGAKGPDEIAIAAAWPMLLGGAADWGDFTVPQTGLYQSRMPYPRGKVLGGSSSINAMAHLRGHRDDYDGWRAAGATAWGYEDLLPYFRRSENAPGHDERYRGTGGPLTVTTAADPHPIADAGLAAIAELGLPMSKDLNGSEQEGAGWLEMNALDGMRQSVFNGYLRPVLDRPNLRVITDARVLSLILKDQRCHGIEYAHDGETHRLEATHEVVLSAGAIGTPQLLMLSGIGPAAQLEALGIDTVLDAPQVGRNLQDHPLIGMVYGSRVPLPAGTNNHAEAIALLRSDPEQTRPDVKLLFMDIPFHPATAVRPPGPAYTIGVALLRPLSRGTVKLTSTDPTAAPAVDPGFYTDDRDLAAMVNGLHLARYVGATQAFAPWRDEEVLPGPSATEDAALGAYLRRDTGTYFHPAGTCRLGSDDQAVLDTQLRVNGIERLRVVDASAMPTIVSANTNATVVAIAERAAEWITTSLSRP
jgi:choline dehydrogenase